MSKNDRWIIITSINPPSKAIIKYAEIKNWTTLVIGDASTPQPWGNSNLNVTYLSLEQQHKLPFRLAKVIPQKSYTRKMIGYLYAISHGAKVIVDTDDDNIPTPLWESQWKLPQDGVLDQIEGDWVNTYALYGAKRMWPRGFPLDSLVTPGKLTQSKVKISPDQLGIIQALADGDPDVDAIYRLTNNQPIHFRKRPRQVVLTKGSFTPINSQNTRFLKKYFPLLYLPTTVTFRSTDIIRGHIAQPILWANHSNLGVAGAEVIQERNPHNYLDDFASEIPIYLHSRAIANQVNKISLSEGNIVGNLKSCYDTLIQAGHIDSTERVCLNAWISDIQDIM